MTTLRAGARGRAETSSALSLHGLTIILFFAASSITTPLFPLYQADWGVSAFQISVIFASYVGTLLLGLLFMGGLSNHFGRRPIILGALVIEGLALVMFLLAGSGSWLIAARLVQGFATGIATTAVAAALLDVDQKTGSLINSLAPMVGMALGALGAGVLVQFAPMPLRLVYVLALALAAIQMLRTWASPETFQNRASMGWSLRPRIEIPRGLRGTFARIIPLNVAVWGVGALFLSLLPGLLHEIAPGPSMGWLSGAEVGLMTLLGGIAVLMFRNRTATTARIWGGVALIVGIGLILLGTTLQNHWLLLMGAVPTGIGFGAGFLGVLRALVARAQPHERAGLVSAFYIASYLPNALLAMIAGYAAQRFGVTDTVLIFGAFIILMAALSFVMIRDDAPS
ncbi:MFS transporter [Brucella pseudogrignonensis]|uniref:MFS transporter n=1 Tax=Brucella pseudogrignonensis TaxID=419475 RepID=UPI001EDB6E19|nr:MFS transporter [Brucella pseudogrignonensis]UKK94711.1 MFS transporter [Brucella pseudogrignonensis]